MVERPPWLRGIVENAEPRRKFSMTNPKLEVVEGVTPEEYIAQNRQKLIAKPTDFDVLHLADYAVRLAELRCLPASSNEVIDSLYQHLFNTEADIKVVYHLLHDVAEKTDETNSRFRATYCKYIYDTLMPKC